MERRVAPAIGTASDRTSIDLRGSGDPSQPDCVDEATNTTSYLLVLDRHGLIKHHAVDRQLAKDSLTRWTHWAAVITARSLGLVRCMRAPTAQAPVPQTRHSFALASPRHGVDSAAR